MAPTSTLPDNPIFAFCPEYAPPRPCATLLHPKIRPSIDGTQPRQPLTPPRLSPRPSN